LKYFIIALLVLPLQAFAFGDLFNDNAHTLAQQQDQGQAQAQNQDQTQRSTSNASQDQTARSASDANSSSQAKNNGNNTDIQYKNDYKKTYSEFVAPAYAPPLAASGDCMGSASAGGSNSVMGFSIGKTYIDENCNARYDAQLLWSMGRKNAAVMRLCSQPKMAAVIPECPLESREHHTDVKIGWTD
jgi:hypothetical protein